MAGMIHLSMIGIILILTKYKMFDFCLTSTDTYTPSHGLFAFVRTYPYVLVSSLNNPRGNTLL
jgi:hypothetical protein